MTSDRGRKPLLDGRGMMPIEDFCHQSGLERGTVEDLMRRGHFGGGLWSDDAQTQVLGVFEDALPSREQLTALGLVVNEDYQPHR